MNHTKTLFPLYFPYVMTKTSGKQKVRNDKNKLSDVKVAFTQFLLSSTPLQPQLYSTVARVPLSLWMADRFQ